MKKSSQELAATIALLARIPLFDGCTVRELERLAATAYPIAFDAGDVLCAEGAEAPECYVVSDGEAVVELDGRQIAVVGPDDIVGERGPIQGRQRAATVKAATHMVTYAISRDEIEHLMTGSAVAATVMQKELVRRYG